MINKKILNFIPNFSFGGVETTNLNLSRELSDLNYEVDFVTNNITNIDYEFNQSVKIKSREIANLLNQYLKPTF